MQTIKLMDGCLHRVTDSGRFTTYLFKLKDGGFGRIYTSPKYRNFHNWKSLEIGDWVSGLLWHNETKGILDGDSPIQLVSLQTNV